MKRLLFTLTITFFAFYIGSSQIVRIGPKLGLNIANYTGNVNNEARSLAGLLAGGVVEIEIMDWFSVQPELLFSVQGIRLGDTSIVNNYVNLPIMAKFYPIDGLYGEIGPQLGFLISASQKNQADRITTTQDYKTVDIGLSFGGGYVLKDVGLGFGIRYYAGLSNIFVDNSRIKNGVFQLSATWTFEL
ncbi:MAG: porin family protein [Bacteroidota bacterium]